MALVLGLALVLVSGMRAVQAWRLATLVATGQVQVQTLRGWMTLPYIARLYRVPERDLRQAIGAPPTGGADRSLRAWFHYLGLDPLAGRQRLEQVILQQGGAGTESPGV